MRWHREEEERFKPQYHREPWDHLGRAEKRKVRRKDRIQGAKRYKQGHMRKISHEK